VVRNGGERNRRTRTQRSFLRGGRKGLWEEKKLSRVWLDSGTAGIEEDYISTGSDGRGGGRVAFQNGKRRAGTVGEGGKERAPCDLHRESRVKGEDA